MNKSDLSRRDFLKLISFLYLSRQGAPVLSPGIPSKSADGRRNVIVLVFDTLSALHIPLYGYVRETMPNLANFAENAIVYHSHYSAGNFTKPGTASILTGTYPWTHRGYHLRGSILDDFSTKNVFHRFRQNQYTCFAFSHNVYVNQLCSQFLESIDILPMPRDVPLVDHNLSDLFFSRDFATAIRSEISYLKYFGTPTNSLFLDTIGLLLRKNSIYRTDEKSKEMFPRGVPRSEDVVCTLEDTFDWVVEQLKVLQNPYLAYIHVMPPHSPYRPRSEFVDLFMDGWQSVPKPEHVFTLHQSHTELNSLRRLYDEYIAYVDAEFGRLYAMLEREGILDNAWLILTSDHGEMFERGILEHTTPTLYEPILRVPLLIHEPGQNYRQDIYTTTCSVDLLPTLFQISGLERPSWGEGIVLPPFREHAKNKVRSIFALEAKRNSRKGPLNIATVAMMKHPYKLIKYWGYSESEDFIELYDLANDPDELNDLSDSRRSLAMELLEELELKINEVNEEGRS